MANFVSKVEQFIGRTINRQYISGSFRKRYASGRSQLYFNVKCCDCGTEKVMKTDTVYNGECGCKCSGRGKMVFRSKTPTRYFKSVAAERKRRNIEFDITQDFVMELLEKQNYKCALSGEPISFENGTCSLDRIDNELGYTPDNVQWLHRTVNFMKNELAERDFVYFCSRVSSNTSA